MAGRTHDPHKFRQKKKTWQHTDRIKDCLEGGRRLPSLHEGKPALSHMMKEYDHTGCLRPFARLAASFSSFQQTYCIEQKEHFRELVQKQRPGAMVLSCCDSRTDPALVFACAPGDIFVSRAIAAFVPPYGSSAGACFRAATAYAVDALKVQDLIIMGHTRCGGISGLVAGHGDGPLADWLEVGRPVLEEARRRKPHADRAVLQRECEYLAPVFSVHNLLHYPWVEKALQEHRLTVHAWLFDLEEGELHNYNFERHEYEFLQEMPRDLVP